MVLLQQPVNCIVSLIDRGVMENPEFDTASQSDNLLLQGERKSRGHSLSMELWSWPGSTSASPGLAPVCTVVELEPYSAFSSSL